MTNATINDVANYAKVSVKTVSRVLNQEKNVRPNTVEKVNQAIHVLGYKPNLHARKLRQNKSYMIALIHCVSFEPYINQVFHGTFKGCEAAGYDMLNFPCSDFSDDLVDRITEMIKRTQVEGLVLVPPMCENQALINTLKAMDVYFVALAPALPFSYPYIASDEISAAKIATEHLISLGHRQIAILAGPEGHGAAKWRLTGYKKAMEEAGITLIDELILSAIGDFESGEKGARKLLNGKIKPSAIFATNDSMAAGVYKVASQMKIQIPTQLSVIGFDDVPLASVLWPPLTTIRQPTIQLAKDAVTMLVKMITEKTAIIPNQLDYNCELVIRHSTGISQN